MFSFAGTMAILFDQMGFSRIQIIIFGSIIQGISMVLFPAISQPMVRKVTGNDNVAFGFWGSSLVTFCGYLGGLVGMIGTQLTVVNSYSTGVQTYASLT